MNNFSGDTFHNKKIGKLGEDLACKFLVKQGFKVLEQNYGKKWGEIDIVLEKGGKLHFVEVKSVSRETSGKNDFKPEENVHFWKIKRLSRIIQTYLASKKVPRETRWQIDVIAVFLNFKTRKASFRMTENIIID
ncbi:YraN family protein [Candidatus Parcubacteria bacterium]|nr:MAG: YraN family protein [Candidatus Parcubacteria bacterium]